MHQVHEVNMLAICSIGCHGIVHRYENIALISDVQFWNDVKMFVGHVCAQGRLNEKSDLQT